LIARHSGKASGSNQRLAASPKKLPEARIEVLDNQIELSEAQSECSLTHSELRKAKGTMFDSANELLEVF
jgi:hypothetical protein